VPVLSLAMVCVTGCHDDPIRVYDAPRHAADGGSLTSSSNAVPSSAVPAEPTDRMLAAVVPHEGTAWFFKVTGPIGAMEGHASEFREFVESLKFGEGGSDAVPTWSLPEAWNNVPNTSSMREATIAVGDHSPPLDLSVTRLAIGGDSYAAYLLMNVNRWRNQMSLPPLDAEGLKRETTVIDLSGDEATLVDLLGVFDQGMRPPFAGGMSGAASGALPDGHPPIGPVAPPSSGAPTTTTPRDGAKLPFVYEMPEPWRKATNITMSVLTLEVVDGSQRIVITVTPAGGDLRGNIDRWRGQIGLADATDEQWKSSTEPISLQNSVIGTYVRLDNPAAEPSPQSIHGAIVSHSGATWFIKLKGDLDLATRESDNFKRFVSSMSFQ
ncbi:MAG: hypothetical protein KDA99_20835, partial [Planctomycetales bacterium]|nr:hypothetical protein [Planctomycetales bacterium]